jgi:hypothetical protein
VAATNPSAERRAAPRFDIIAQASVVCAGKTHLLSIRNISASGVFLIGRPREHADLVPGAQIEVTISTTVPGAGGDLIDIDEVINIECRGRVARTELRTPSSPGGFGIALEPKTTADREQLEDLLGRLIDLPPAQRPVSIG